MVKLMRLHVTLEHIEPPVWRRVVIPADLTFGHLHDVLQILFDWEDDHLHAFTVGKKTIASARIASDLEGNAVDEDLAEIGAYLNRTGMRARYEYDFGDSWLHTIRLEATEEAEEPVVLCLEGERAAPPEDCGGPWGYQNMLEALSDPRHPEHDTYREWIGEWFPERFNRDEINESLARLERYWMGEYEVDEWVADAGDWELDEELEMPEIRFIPQHESVLRDVEWASQPPGTIVADFDTVLDYVDEHAPLLTSRGAPRPADLRRMNQRLRAPLGPDRPQPGRSAVPDLYGIFLLLRASGLTVMKWNEGRPQLVVDQAALGQWRAFSTVEQYGHLLEGWLFHIQDLFDDDVFGAGDAGPWATLHMLWPLIKAGAYDQMPPGDVTLMAEEMIGLPQLMLAAAFGWVDVGRSGEPQAPIASVRTLPLGEAILARLWKRIVHDPELRLQLMMGDHPDASRGRLRGLFLPYWPGWRRSLEVPGPALETGRFTLRIIRDEESWQLTVPGATSFSRLADHVLETIGQPPNHLYRFLVPDARYGGLYAVTDPLMGELPAATQVQVGEVGLVPGMRFYFHFDFSADRYYDIEVEAVVPGDG